MYGAGAYDPSMGAPPAGYPMGAPQGGYDPASGMQYDPSMGQPGTMPQYGQPGMMPQYDASMGQQGMMPQQYDPYMAQSQVYSPDGTPMPQYNGQAMPQADPMVAQAEAELQALEEKKKAQAEKDKKKEIDHVAHMMRSGNRNQEDNVACANILVMWAVFNGLMWAVPLLGDRWWGKVWHGMSIDKLTVNQGLFNMEIEVNCKDSLDTSLCKAVKKYADHDNGHWAIYEIKEEMCKKVPESCPSMKRMYQAGWAPLCLLPGAAGFEVLAMLLLYFYWHGKPTALVRNLANKCGVLAPITGVLGVTGWLIWCPYMQQLPRWWAAEAGHADFANSAVFGLQAASGIPTGWCFCMLVFAAISSGIRFFCQFTLPFHIQEPDPYGFDESSKLLAEAEKMYDSNKA